MLCRLGNMVRMQLHEDRAVVFAGYRIPHPLESKMVVMIQAGLLCGSWLRPDYHVCLGTARLEESLSNHFR